MTFKDAKIIDNFLTKTEYDYMIKYYDSIPKNVMLYDEKMKRYTQNDSMSFSLLISKTIIARKIFGSDILLPTYSVYANYIGPGSILPKHKDDNACTFTLDVCLRQTHEWPLWVENKSYTLKENQALAYYGNDQFHWREEMTWNGNTEMLFLHYAEPSHKWFREKKIDTKSFNF